MMRHCLNKKLMFSVDQMLKAIKILIFILSCRNDPVLIMYLLSRVLKYLVRPKIVQPTKLQDFLINAIFLGF